MRKCQLSITNIEITTIFALFARNNWFLLKTSSFNKFYALHEFDWIDILAFSQESSVLLFDYIY